MAIPKLDQCYARATVYRYLSLIFAYPVGPLYDELRGLADAALVAAPLVSDEVATLTAELVHEIEARDRHELGAEYRNLFTHSASPDCPLNESAYSVKHIFQETQELADIAGFYGAFGVELMGDRPDSLSAELEFCYLLNLKEATAREQRLSKSASICREARKRFIHDHLGRWAENIGRRIGVLAPETAYAAAGRLTCALAADEIWALGISGIVPYQEVPNPPAPPDDEGCLAEEGMGTVAVQLMEQEDYLGQLREVAVPGGVNAGGL